MSETQGFASVVNSQTGRIWIAQICLARNTFWIACEQWRVRQRAKLLGNSERDWRAQDNNVLQKILHLLD